MGRDCDCDKKCSKKLSCKKEVARFDAFYAAKEDELKEANFYSARNVICTVPDITPFAKLVSTNFPCGDIAFNAWCMDKAFELAPSLTNYALVSLMDPKAPEIATGYATECQRTLPFVNTNFPAVLYILNQVERYEKVSGYTSSQIQNAIWFLTNDFPIEDPDVQLIVNEALNAQRLWNENGKDTCKYLATNKIVGLLALPLNLEAGICKQTLVLQITLCQFHELLEKCPKPCQ